LTPARFAMALGVALVMIAVLPTHAYAWTPGTHIYLGETVLANLAQLPDVVTTILRAYPYDFLYGNIAADTSIAKKYAPVGRHCHSWQVGREIYNTATQDALRAFGLGYLSHLAADCVAHNYFVPRQLVITSRTIALGHSYWESRFETHLGDQHAKTAMEVLRVGFDEADAHLDRILAPTIFSVRTSRRLFRGMVGLTETQSWQRVFRVAAETSKWDLTDVEVEAYMGASFQFVMELLSEDDPAALKLDPSGEASLHLAKRMRIGIMKRMTSPQLDELTTMADEHFSLPVERRLGYWNNSTAQRPWTQPSVEPHRTARVNRAG
jgi:Zinc dependent phospholipase C